MSTSVAAPATPSPSTPAKASKAAAAPKAKVDKADKPQKPVASKAPKALVKEAKAGLEAAVVAANANFNSKLKKEVAKSAMAVGKKKEATKKVSAPASNGKKATATTATAANGVGQKRHNRVVHVSLEALPSMLSDQRLRLLAAPFELDRFQGNVYDENGNMVEAGPLLLAKQEVTTLLIRIGTVACLLARSRGVKRPRGIDVARAYKIVTGLTLYLSHDEYTGEPESEGSSHKSHVTRANRDIRKAKRERLATESRA